MTETEQIPQATINSTPTPKLNQLLAKATNYHNMGLAVVPFILYWDNEKQQYNKDNIGKWAQWETQPQTDEEFNALQWKKNSIEANAFAVLLGTKAKNGKYLSVVDHDTKGNTLKPGAVEKGKEILKDFPITKTTKTANGGLHYEYWSTIKPKIEGTFHDEAALELLGEKKLCVMVGLGYLSLNDNPPTEIYDVEGTFYSVLKKHGFTLNEETEIENQQDNCSCQMSKIIDLTKLQKIGDYEYQGRHPTHDSTTEKNFCVNIKDNSWHCFRHNSGGGALQFLAVKEGIIKCEQAKKGALRGSKFKEVLKIAVSQKLVDEKILEQNEINPVILAKDIMEDYTFVVDKESNALFFYDTFEGIYSNSTEQSIKREIAKRLDENFKARYYTEINEFIKATAPLVKMDSAAPEILPIKNGLLNVLTKQISEYTSAIYVTNKLNDVIFDPTEKNTTWQAFLDQVLSDKKQQRQLQQLIGHCLYKKIVTETCPILLGKGANGKTITLLTIIKFLGGSKNVSSHSIQQLCYDKFATGEIRGKLANICADLPHKELLNTAIFKGLTSGDSLEAYIKHVQKTVSFIPTTKYIFSANQTPPVANEEDTFAWYRRFVFLDYNVTFTGEKAKSRQELLDSLSTSAAFSEILNWALIGLADLIKNNGDVTDRPTTEEIRLQYIRRSDSALAYFNDKVTITNSPNDYVFVEVWFRDYVTYCHINNLKPKTQGEFINTIKNHLPGADKARIRPDKDSNPLAVYRYVKLTLTDPSLNPVPGVPTVSIFQTTLPKIEKITTTNNINSEQLISKVGTPDTPGTLKSGIVKGYKLQPTAGRFCSSEEQGVPCALEAIYDLNGNLFCLDHFEEEKESLRKINKIVCLDDT